MATPLLSYTPTVNGLTSGSVEESPEPLPGDAGTLRYILDSFSGTGVTPPGRTVAVLLTPAAQAAAVTHLHRQRVAPVGARVVELKARSGLTWEQIARLFGVSKRAVMLWKAGGRMSSTHEERLALLAGRVEQLTYDEPEQTRAELLSLGDDGRSPYQRWVEEVSPSRTGAAWIDRQPDPL